jgi:hypothetical protein
VLSRSVIRASFSIVGSALPYSAIGCASSFVDDAVVVVVVDAPVVVVVDPPVVVVVVEVPLDDAGQVRELQSVSVGVP